MLKIPGNLPFNTIEYLQSCFVCFLFVLLKCYILSALYAKKKKKLLCRLTSSKFVNALTLLHNEDTKCRFKCLKGFEVVNFWPLLKIVENSLNCEDMPSLWALEECICEQALSVSLQNGITSYCPGMHNTVIIDIFRDPCEWAIFKNT